MLSVWGSRLLGLWQLRRGQYYLARGRISQAISILEKAVRACSRQALWHVHLARAYAADEQWDKARASLTQAAHLASDNHIVKLFQGRILIACQDYNAAQMILQAAAQQAPHNLLIRGYLALLALQQGDPKHCRQLVNHKELPASQDLQIALLLTLERQLQQQSDSPVQSQDQKDLDHNAQTGATRQAAGEKGTAETGSPNCAGLPPAAEEGGDAAEASKPKKASAFQVSSLVQAAYACLDKQEYDQALAKLAEATAKDPTNAELWAYLGEVHILRRAYDQAQLAFDRWRNCLIAKALAQDPLTKYVMGLEGRILLEKGNLTEALHKLEQARSQGAREAEIYYALGLAYWYLGRRREAYPVFTAIESLDPNFYYHKIKQLLGLLAQKGSTAVAADS